MYIKHWNFCWLLFLTDFIFNKQDCIHISSLSPILLFCGVDLKMLVGILGGILKSYLVIEFLKNYQLLILFSLKKKRQLQCHPHLKNWSPNRTKIIHSALLLNVWGRWNILDLILLKRMIQTHYIIARMWRNGGINGLDTEYSNNISAENGYFYCFYDEPRYSLLFYWNSFILFPDWPKSSIS